VHKHGVMLRAPVSPGSSMRRKGPCTLVERPAAVRVVAQPDRQGQLGKADRRRVALLGWWAGLLHRWERGGSKGRIFISMLAVTFRGANHQSREQIQGTKSTPKPPLLSLASPSPAPPPPATATCRGQARLCAPEP
jgi:hypothetical protein